MNKAIQTGLRQATKTMEEDLRNLEFLANNSKEVIEKQVDSYRQQHSYAGTIIGFTINTSFWKLNSVNWMK